MTTPTLGKQCDPIGLNMLDIIESFESDFKCLSRKQIKYMRYLADAELIRRNKPDPENWPPEYCIWRKAMDPGKLAKDVLNRKARSEDAIVGAYMVVIATRAQITSKTGTVSARLNAAHYALKYALQAIALYDSVIDGVQKGESTYDMDVLLFMFTAIRPVASDIYFLTLWNDMKELIENKKMNVDLEIFNKKLSEIFNLPY